MSRRSLLFLAALLLMALQWGLRQSPAPVLAQTGPGSAIQETQSQAPADQPAAAPVDAHAAAGGGGSGGGGGQTGGHNHLAKLLLALLVILVGAKAGAEIFDRLGQPAVLGEIIVGVVIGNLALFGWHQLDYIATDEMIGAFAEIGVIVLLFEVGLESNVGEMAKVGVSSLLVAVIGVVLPFFLGWGVAHLFLPDANVLTHAFIGATLTATSVGITARVLKDMGQLQRPESRIILGAAILDDVMGLVILAVMGGIINASNMGQSMNVAGVGIILLKAVGFLVGAIVIGSWGSPRLFSFASKLRAQHMLLVSALSVCFLFSWLAGVIGLAPIVGAFAAGLVLDEVHYRGFRDRGEHGLEELVRPISAFLVPVFFVVTGAKVQISTMLDPAVLAFAAVLTVAAIIGKQACGLGVREKGLNRVAVGLGMIPRGEVGLIFAGIGLTLYLGTGDDAVPVVDEPTFGAVVAMVMITTLVTPPLLKWSMSRSDPAGGDGDDEDPEAGPDQPAETSVAEGSPAAETTESPEDAVTR